MKLPQDARFREERQRYRFRFTCEHCGLYDPEAERCAHDFPIQEHRTSYYEQTAALLVFCKEFEHL